MKLFYVSDYCCCYLKSSLQILSKSAIVSKISMFRFWFSFNLLRLVQMRFLNCKISHLNFFFVLMINRIFWCRTFLKINQELITIFSHPPSLSSFWCLSTLFKARWLSWKSKKESWLNYSKKFKQTILRVTIGICSNLLVAQRSNQFKFGRNEFILRVDKNLFSLRS